MRAPLLFAAGAIATIAVGLASEVSHSLVGLGWRLQHTTDSTAATHFALVGGAVFGGFAALHWWFPKMTGRTMGETLARFSFWTMAVGILVAFVPLFLAGAEEGQVVDAYKFFNGTGVNADNLIATIGAFVLATGIMMTVINAILSRRPFCMGGHRRTNPGVRTPRATFLQTQMLDLPYSHRSAPSVRLPGFTSSGTPGRRENPVGLQACRPPRRARPQSGGQHRR